MSQTTKTLLLAVFISLCWLTEEIIADPGIYGGIAGFLVSGRRADRRRDRLLAEIETPDPDSIRRYIHIAKTCPEIFAIFEGYEERSPQPGKRG